MSTYSKKKQFVDEMLVSLRLNEQIYLRIR